MNDEIRQAELLPAPHPGERIAAALGLAGMFVIWIVAIIPCVLWVGIVVLIDALRAGGRRRT